MYTNSISRFDIAVLLAATAASSSAQNMLSNPGFEEWQDNGFYSYTGVGGDGSCAADWYVDNVNYGTTVTEEESPPPGLANSGNYSMFLSSSVAGNGVFQQFGNSMFGSTVYSVSGWVDVVSGSVAVQLAQANGTNVTTYASTSQTGGWVYLAANTGGVSFIYDFLITATSPNTEFYADNMDADASPLTPEPSSLAVLGLAAWALLRGRSRKH